MLSNLLFPGVNARQGQAAPKRAPCYCTVAAAEAGAEWFTCRTVATAGAGVKVNPAVTSDHYSSMIS